jgi:hypothetical protein
VQLDEGVVIIFVRWTFRKLSEFVENFFQWPVLALLGVSNHPVGMDYDLKPLSSSERRRINYYFLRHRKSRILPDPPKACMLGTFLLRIAKVSIVADLCFAHAEAMIRYEDRRRLDLYLDRLQLSLWIFSAKFGDAIV